MSKKAETKKQLKQKLDERPEPQQLEERGILPQGTMSKAGAGKGSRKGSAPSWGKKESAASLPGTPQMEKRKSSVFGGRTKSSKMSAGDVLPSSVIGQSVPEACEREGVAVPRLVEQCIAQLNKLGFEEKGIFRVSGDKSRVDQLVAEFDRCAVPLPLEGVEDVHVVASLLKLFFRLAPQPLFTVEAHAALLAACSGPEATREATYVELLKGLPGPCLSTVAALFPMLRAVADRSEVNLMSAANLGLVFGPTLMRSQAELNGEVDMSNRSAYAVEFMIAHWPALSKALGRSSASSSSPTSAAPPAQALPPPVSPVKAVGMSAVASADTVSTPVLARNNPPVKLANLANSSSAVALRKGPPPLPGGAASSNNLAMSSGALPTNNASHPPPAASLPPPPGAFQLPPPVAVGSPAAVRRPLPPNVAGARPVSTGSSTSVSPAATPSPPPPSATPPPLAVLPPPPVLPGGARAAVALYNFSGDASKGQIDLAKGAAVVVHVEHAAGWSTVECNGKTGFVPSSYVK